jgi:hypothetical protein
MGECIERCGGLRLGVRGPARVQISLWGPVRRSGGCVVGLLAEPQDGREGFVDPPLLVWTDPAHQIAQPSGVDRADLLN